MGTIVKAPEWTLADRLRKAREHAGLDQATLADELGVSRNSISNYERGSTVPTASRLRLWARVTGVPLEWLLGLPEMQPFHGAWALAA